MKVIKHIIKEGSREHVEGYLGVADFDGKITNSKIICSTSNCEKNYPNKKIGDEI